MLPGVAFPRRGQFGDLLRVPLADVDALSGVVARVEQQPLVVAEGRHAAVVGDDVPAVAMEPTMAEHRVVLLGVRARRIRVGQRPGEAATVHLPHRHALARLGHPHPCEFDERGQQIGGVLILEAHRTGLARRNPRTGDDARHGVPPGERVLLEQAPWRARHHAPSARVVRQRRGATHLVELGDVALQRRRRVTELRGDDGSEVLRGAELFALAATRRCR